jgi:hypothetical protein
MFKGKKSYDAELKKHDVKLDRAKPAPAPSQLDPEKLDETSKRKPIRK